MGFRTQRVEIGLVREGDVIVGLGRVERTLRSGHGRVELLTFYGSGWTLQFTIGDQPRRNITIERRL
jgi:hypothetical protein